MESDCLICGEIRTDGEAICKMCGMKYVNGTSYSGFGFCSESCKNFFIDISTRSPEMARREIVI